MDEAGVKPPTTLERALTLLKLLSISLIYFVLLGITMMGGLVIAMWGLA
jgi:hypothetical protein